MFARRVWAAGWLVAVVAWAAAAQRPQPPQPGPEMQRLFSALAGSWEIEEFDHSWDIVTGTGTEVWSVGPGGLSILEEYRSRQLGQGTYSGHGVAWWDAAAKGYRVVWCDNRNPAGCRMMPNVARWNGDRLELKWMEVRDGKKIEMLEMFSHFSKDEFTQSIYERRPGEKKFGMVLRIEAKRKK